MSLDALRERTPLLTQEGELELRKLLGDLQLEIQVDPNLADNADAGWPPYRSELTLEGCS